MPVEYLSRKQLRNSGLLPKRKSSRMNLFSGMKEGYAFLIDMIIRPPRANYTLEDLGPKVFQIAGHKYERRDFEIVNSRGLKLQCSHFVSSAQLKKLAEGKDATHPCVVYLHGNCGCRVDATVALPLLLPAGFSVFCFDFSGSGLSEGEYISLGFYEKDDVTTIVEYLRGCKLVSTIGLWGRSMGAATALMFGASDPSIAGMVLDSPFSSLSKLANELVEHNSHQLPVGIPKIAVSVGMKAIRKSIVNKTGLDINELSPIKFAESGFSPVLFVHGQEDDFIQPHHSRELMEKYSGEKNLIIVEGDHNSPRPEYCLDSISIFFHNTLGAMVGEEPVAEESEPVPFPHFSEKPHFGEMYNSMPHGLVDPEDDDELLQQAMMLSLQEHEKSKDASAV